MSFTGSAPVRQPAPDVSGVGPASVPQEPGEGPYTAVDHQQARGRSIAQMRLLWEHRRLLGRTTFCALCGSLLLAFLIPVRYEATTRLMPPDAPVGLGMLAAPSARGGGSLGGMAGDLLGVKNGGALFVGILQSRTVADRLIAEFHLRSVYHISKIEDARNALASHTAISEDRKSGILTITVTEHDALRAAAMAQAYVTELDRLVAEVSTSSARRERVFLEERLRSVKSDLDTAARQFSDFASKNTAIDIPAQGKAMVEAAATLQGQLIAAESELSGLQQIYTSNNVRVRALQARVGELRQQLEKLGDGGTSAGGAEKESLYPSIQKLPLLGVTYADLYRRTKIQETIYELLTQQYELAKVQEAKEIPAVKVLDAAVVPTKESFPPRLLIVFLGSLFGMAGAVAWVLERAHWQEVAPDDPGKVFATQVFETVNEQMPWAPPNGSRVQAMTHRVWLRLVRRSDSAESAEAPSGVRK